MKVGCTRGKSASELLFVDRVRKTGAKLLLTTEDGSTGKKGGSPTFLESI
jgi:hypothetical protein